MLCVVSLPLSSYFRPSWTALSSGNIHVGSLFVRDESGNLTPSPSAQKATIADSTEKVVKLRPDPTPSHGGEAETAMPVLSEKSFEKLPQWDFDDVYNLDAPPRHTVSMF